MFAMTATVRHNLRADLGVTADKGRVPAAFNRLWKETMMDGLKFWHAEFLPRHFTREAYNLYGSEYPKPKRPPSKPLVRSGTLRDRLCGKQQLKNIMGTARGVSLKLQYGRPKGLAWMADKDKLDNKIYAVMAVMHTDYKTARNYLFRNAGFHPYAKDVFAKALQAINEAEERAIANYMQERFMEQWKKRGPVRRRKV